MGQMGESLRDAFLCGGISEEESAVRVSERILKGQAEPAMDKAKSRYALETDLEIIIGKEKQSQSEAKNRTQAG